MSLLYQKNVNKFEHFFQFLSMEMKREDQMRPYDPKKSVWVPTESHDFKEGLLESDDGTKAVVMLGHEVSCYQTLNLNLNLLVFLQIMERIQNMFTNIY